MATLVEVVEALAERLRSIDDVFVHPMFEGDTQVPALVVMAPGIPVYHEAFGGALAAVRSVDVDVLALVAPAETGHLLVAQRRLMELADVSGARSVPAAIAADRTLGGVVASTVLRSFEVAGSEEVGQIGYWAGRFSVRVQAAT
jgi:hypothetical protein